MKFYLILILLFSVQWLLGQSPVLKFGNEIKTSGRAVVKNVCFADNDVFLIRKKGKRLFSKEKWLIDKLNNESLNSELSKEFTVLFSDPKIKTGKIISFNNQMVIAGLKSSNEKKEIILKTISNQLGLESNSVVVDTLNENEYISYDLLELKNNSHLLTCFAGNKGAKLFLKIKQIDSLLSISKSRVFSFDIPYKSAELVKLEMVESNLVYALIKHSPKEGGIFGYDLYKYSLMACDLQSGLFKEFEIELPDKNITDIGIKFSGNHSLMVSGFYSNKKNTQDDIAGVFYLNISNTNLNIIGKGVKELPDELKRNFLSERKLKKGKELSGFTINYIIPNTDGGSIVLAEQNYTSQVCNTDFRTGIVYCNDYYYYNDIIAIRINADGEIDWTSKIGKKQVSINDNGFYSSYFPFIVKNGFYLIFNDNVKNVGIIPQNPASTGNFRKAVPVKVFVENNGKVGPVELLSVQKQAVILRPKVYFQKNAAQGIILGRKNGNDVLGKIFIEGN